MYSVSRDFARSCQTPMLVMPDDTPSHSYEAAMDLVALAPNAEVTPYPWKESEDLFAQTIEQVREFLLGASTRNGRSLRAVPATLLPAAYSIATLLADQCRGDGGRRLQPLRLSRAVRPCSSA